MALKKSKATPGRASADRFLTILSCFQRGDESLSLAEIAARTGLVKSTALRLSASLIDHNFLIKDLHGDYRLGPEVARLNLIYTEAMRAEHYVIPVLQSLVDISGETASIYIRHGSYRLCQYRVNSPHQLGVHKQPGEIRPMDDASSAKVLRRYGGSGKDQPGFALPLYSSGASDPYAASLSIPVFQNGGVLFGALVLAGPCNRLTQERADQLADPMRASARLLSRQLGGEVAYEEALKASREADA
ncbi:IclR family transcriptional regulator [Altererythrobacter sp. Z27]|uniref:IclR family transcriptional regulator n=1 Tax=Altererythrobacter sp. Z27 TaxID=3461147 RepID=UPI004044BE26